MAMNTGGGRGHDYRESDVRVVLKERGPWSDWSDVARWLHSDGRKDSELKPSDVDRMLHDIDNLVLDNVPFTDEPGEAFKLARAHRRTTQKGARRRVMPHNLHKGYPRI